MTRYIQRVVREGMEQWTGWEVDGVGTEVPGLVLAEELSEEELKARGVTDFRPMPFETFLELGATLRRSDDLMDRDVEFRLDALEVGICCVRDRGIDAIPLQSLIQVFGSKRSIAHPRVQERLRQWQSAGKVEFIGSDDCYLRVTGKFA